MEYQSPEVKNLNTPVPTGLNDYVWQHNYAVVETAVVGFLVAVGFQGISFVEVVGPVSEPPEDN